MENDVHIIHNIFKDDERRKLIELSKHHLKDKKELDQLSGRDFTDTGTQTLPNLHEFPEFHNSFSKIIQIINKGFQSNLGIQNAWVNCQHRRRKIVWHSHEGKPTRLSPETKYTPIYSAVYYMRATPYINAGILFQQVKTYKPYFIRCKQNSLLIFPSHIQHSIPRGLTGVPKRYTLAIDLVENPRGGYENGVFNFPLHMDGI